MRQSNPVLWKNVKITDDFWKSRIDLNESITLPAGYKQSKETGRIDSIKCVYSKNAENNAEYAETIDGLVEIRNANSVAPPKPHHYWDSDVAKWIEAASYYLAYKDDKETEQRIDEIVEDFQKEQFEDGYIDTYYTVVEPGKRWTNLYQMHELYNAGHLIEAAIAYYQATGKTRFLTMVSKYIDYINTVFGPEKDKLHGYPGHQEIEQALVKLYRLTGKKRYLDLAKYFIDERGRQPLYFEQEAIKLGKDVNDGGPRGIFGRDFLAAGPYARVQSHLPVRDQKTAEGHAVRFVYMCTGMVDVAIESNDKTLFDAAETLWENVTEKRMSITGGIGSMDYAERFTYDYYLPNETCYNETCASVGLAMWAYRFLQADANTKYADILEKVIYNGILSGVSLSGDRFFYANHLASDPDLFKARVITNPRMLPERQPWFDISCCPMNLARTIESIGGYMYTASDTTIFIHLYASNEAVINGHRIIQKTRYPWDGSIQIIPEEGEYGIALRIPSWCEKWDIRINGKESDYENKKGYVYLNRKWGKSDTITLDLEMKPFLIESHPSVRMNSGKAAIQYGPLIYCLEEIDNGNQVFDIFINSDCHMEAKYEEALLNGVITIEGDCYVHDLSSWKHRLYDKVSESHDMIPMRFKAVPYYAWANRGPGKMTVWINLLKE